MKKFLLPIAFLAFAGTLANAQELVNDDYVAVEMDDASAPNGKKIVLVKKIKNQPTNSQTSVQKSATPPASKPVAQVPAKQTPPPTRRRSSSEPLTYSNYYEYLEEQERLKAHSATSAQAQPAHVPAQTQNRVPAKTVPANSPVQNNVPTKNPQANANPKAPEYFSLEGFFAHSSETDYPDLGGIWMTTYFEVPIENNFSFNLGVTVGVGAGSEDGWDYDSDGDRFNHDLRQRDLLCGFLAGGTYQINARLSVSAGLMLGVDWRNSTAKIRYEGYYPTEKDDDDWGYFYGVYAHADFQLTSQWALTAGFRYINTVVENDFGDLGKLDDDVKYSIFSIGAKYSF